MQTSELFIPLGKPPDRLRQLSEFIANGPRIQHELARLVLLRIGFHSLGWRLLLGKSSLEHFLVLSPPLLGVPSI